MNTAIPQGTSLQYPGQRVQKNDFHGKITPLYQNRIARLEYTWGTTGIRKGVMGIHVGMDSATGSIIRI